MFKKDKRGRMFDERTLSWVFPDGSGRVTVEERILPPTEETIRKQISELASLMVRRGIVTEKNIQLL